MTDRDILLANKNDIINYFKEGKSYRWISKKYQCNDGNVWYFINNLGLGGSRKQHPNCGKIPEHKEEILRRIKEGESASKIAESLGFKPSSMCKFLAKCGVKLETTYDKDNMAEDHTEKIIELYKGGMSALAIGKELGFACGNPILKILRKNNIEVDTKRIEYPVNEDFFKIIDTQEKAYVLGFWFSDGNVMKSGTIRIALQEGDKEILEKINMVMQNQRPLNYKKAKNETSQPQYELAITRKSMANDLITLGCVPAKSLITRFPTLRVDLIPHFVRRILRPAMGE